MKILSVGLDETTITFLSCNGILVEKPKIKDMDDLVLWFEYGSCDACVLDLEKAGFGIYMARSIRIKGIKTSLIGISKGSEDQVWGDHRALFLENGGDDLLRGPVNPRELGASISAVTRRFKGSLLDIIEHESGESTLKVNLTTRSVTINDLSVGLTGKELALMLLLASNPGRVLSKEMLLTQMYVDGVDGEPEMKIIDVFVSKLRKKLSDIHPDAGKLVETVWGRGYRITEKNEMSWPKSMTA